MSVTAYGQLPAVGMRLMLSSPREDHEARAQQSCCDAIDAASDADAAANRRVVGASGNVVADTPTFAEKWHARPGALDRFAPAPDRPAE